MLMSSAVYQSQCTAQDQWHTSDIPAPAPHANRQATTTRVGQASRLLFVIKSGEQARHLPHPELRSRIKSKDALIGNRETHLLATHAVGTDVEINLPRFECGQHIDTGVPHPSQRDLD
jgi:hypothetical protein